MRLNRKTLAWFAIGVMSIGSVNVSAANIAVIAEETAVLTKRDSETISLKAGDRIKMILDENFHQGDIAKVDMNGTYGYIDKSAIHLKEIETEILEEGVKLRKKPSPSAEVVATLDKDDSVTAYYKYVDWYAVESESGQKGFIYETQINEDNLYLLDRKNTQQLNALFGESSLVDNSEGSNKSVEVIKWSTASKVLPRGGIATIEDVYTGKRFAIKRTFGTNHADVEALTASDTNIMKQIWGGFSWQRRPVIVHVDGRRLAASMAGMPHAGKDSAPNLSYTWGRSNGYGYGQNLDAVKGNAMGGVCDLHFRGSTKHKDGRISATVDPLHQAAISVAAKYK